MIPNAPTRRHAKLGSTSQAGLVRLPRWPNPVPRQLRPPPAERAAQLRARSPARCQRGVGSRSHSPEANPRPHQPRSRLSREVLMLLYHGTNGHWLNNILATGLTPRGRNQTRNNWKHVPHQSNPRCVYLTDSYAPFFAFNAARGNAPTCAVIEIDTDRLNPRALFPDEDCLEQLGRNRDGVPGNMSQRTLYYRARQLDPLAVGMYTKEGTPFGWQDSLRALGTAAHFGPIPASAITRAVTWPHNENIHLAFVWDPSIVILNQQICGPRYRTLTAKLFAGDFTDPKDITIAAHQSAALDPERAPLPPITGWQLITPPRREEQP